MISHSLQPEKPGRMPLMPVQLLKQDQRLQQCTKLGLVISNPPSGKLFLAAAKFVATHSFCSGAIIPFAIRNPCSLRKEGSPCTRPVYWMKGGGQQSTDRISETKLAHYYSSHPTVPSLMMLSFTYWRRY